jgi:hypothetical protein
VLVEGYPFIESEVTYACKHECAVTVKDVLALRTRLAFLNSEATGDRLKEWRRGVEGCPPVVIHDEPSSPPYTASRPSTRRRPRRRSRASPR